MVSMRNLFGGLVLAALGLGTASCMLDDTNGTGPDEVAPGEGAPEEAARYDDSTITALGGEVVEPPGDGENPAWTSNRISFHYADGVWLYIHPCVVGEWGPISHGTLQFTPGQVNNGCPFRVWLSQNANGTGYRTCLSPHTNNTIRRSYRRYAIGSSTSHC
jgi:hypothetical protein